MNENDIIYECNDIFELLDFMTNNHYNINIINYVKKHLLCINNIINNVILYDDMIFIIYKMGYPLQCEQFYMDLML